MYIFIIIIIIKFLTCQYLCAIGMDNHAKNVKLAPVVMLHAAALLTSDTTYSIQLYGLN